MKSGPRRTVLAIADAMFERSNSEGGSEAVVDEVLGFVAAASFASRVTLRAALLLLSLAPLLVFASWRPLARLERDRRRAVLARIEGTPLGLAFVAWRTLLILHFYEGAQQLARIGYREERRRHLAVIPPVVPAAAESGVRLRDDVDEATEREQGEQGGREKGAA